MSLESFVNDWGPFVGGTLSFFNGLLFYYVGHVVSKRQVSGDDRVANLAFVGWWYGLAALSILGSFFSVAAAAGFTNLAFHTTLLYVLIFGLCAALAGLTYYLAYLFTGRSGLLLPVSVFYAFYLVFLLYVITASAPNGVAVEQWQTRVTYEREIAQDPLVQGVLLLLVVPPILGALGYMSLLFRVQMPLQRYRITMVSGGFVVWFGSSLVASLVGLNDLAWWPLVSRFVSLAATFVILFAFQPPESLVRRLEQRATPEAGGAGA